MSNKSSPASNSMWGGRFADKPDAIMEEINASIGFDQRLANEDIRGSQAHAAMLAACGIISDADHQAISQGLETVKQEMLIGEPAGRLHTARSRNDQVATDFRLWVKGQCEAAEAALSALIDALLTQAEEGADIVMPGFTHLQVAQPVTWGHHMLAYVEMFARDRSRFTDARARMDECPLGAAALAGTGFAIDREMTAKALGFARPTANSIDSVSARDFAGHRLSSTSSS